MDLEALLKHGWPTAALITAGLFFWKGLWPFLKKQIDTAQEENREQTRAFLTALERRDAEFSKVVQKLDAISSKIEPKPPRKRRT